MDDQKLAEKIEAYLLSQLSPEDSVAMEAQIAANPDLAERVAMQKITLGIAETLGQQHMQRNFAQWRAETEKAKVRKRRLWIVLGIVILLAGIALLVARRLAVPRESVLTPLTPPPTPPENLPDTLRKTPQDQPVAAQAQGVPDQKAIRQIAYAELGNLEWQTVFRGSSQAAISDNPFATADSLLLAGRFTQALAQIRQIRADSVGQYQRLALVYHKLGQPKEAILAYKQYVRLTSDNEEKNDWMLCLYYLAGWPDYESEFKDKLQKMTGREFPNHAYRFKAEQLKKRLKAVAWRE